MNIGGAAFACNKRLTGILEIPDNVLSIGSEAFANCGIQEIIFPGSLESIHCNKSFGSGLGGAFANCFDVNKIVCKGMIPPYVQDGAFEGVAKDNFTLEVPESVVEQYRAAPGWREFK